RSATGGVVAIWHRQVKISSSRTPRARARVYDAWITAPSAIGSLYGKPISTRSAPARPSSRTTSGVDPRSGSPAVRNGMNALRPWDRRRWNRASMGFIVLPTGPALDVLAAQAGYLETILVAAAREADHDHILLRPPGRHAHRLDHGVGRLQGRQDAL